MLVGDASTQEVKKSLWYSINKGENYDKLFSLLDGADLELNFCSKSSKMKKKGSQEMKKKEATSQDSMKDMTKTTQIVSNKRNNELAIMLSRMPSFEEIATGIRTLDEQILSHDQVDVLSTACPTQEEMAMVQNHPAESLELATKFILHMSAIPQVSARLECWKFKLHFEEHLSDTLRPLRELAEAYKALHASVRWKQLMACILAVGNFLNGSSSSRGRADGFTIDILTKLAGMKDITKSTSLLEYIVAVATDLHGKDFAWEMYEELSPIVPAKCISVKDVSSQARKLIRQAEKSKKMVSVVLGLSEVQDPFEVVMGAFYDRAGSSLQNLEEQVKTAYQAHIAAIQYLDPSLPANKAQSVSSEEFFTLLDNFVFSVKAVAEKSRALKEEEEREKKQEENQRMMKQNVAEVKLARERKEAAVEEEHRKEMKQKMAV